MIVAILIALLFASNAMWIYFWNTYDYVDDEVMVNAEDDGTANYIGNNGDINNGVCIPTQAEQAVKTLQPKLYDAVLKKLQE